MASNQSQTTLPTPQFQLRLAKPGFDVRTATDYELAFSSAWPSLAIGFTATVTADPDGFGIVSAQVPHPLGFPCFCMAWQIKNGISLHRVFPRVTSTSVDITDFLVSQTTTFYLECYVLDLSKSVSYNFIPPPPVNIGGPYDPHYAWKFAKAGKTTDSNKLNDYVVHSQAQSPAILVVDTNFDKVPKIVGAKTITFTSPRDYVPWVFGYEAISSGGQTIYIPAPPYSQTNPGLFINTFGKGTFTVACESTAVAGALVVLRDPLFVANTVSVTYG